MLSLEDFLDGEDAEKYFREAFEKVDGVRRKKAECMKVKGPQAACLGAGLLMQLAVREALEKTWEEPRGEIREEPREGTHGGEICIRKDSGADIELSAKKGYHYRLSVYTVPQMLGLLGSPLDLKLYYGEKGKPYLRDHPFYFNLSHSGSYVVCALSRHEVGVDIQQYKRTDIDRLAERFFSTEEKKALKACHDRKELELLFYRLWTRKEAYGKLTGEGIAAVIDRSVLPLIEGEMPAAEAGDEPSLFWQEWTLEGYGIALCQYGGKS